MNKEIVEIIHEAPGNRIAACCLCIKNSVIDGDFTVRLRDGHITHCCRECATNSGLSLPPNPWAEAKGAK